MIIWDLNKDLEQESFDLDSNALFFQDSKGSPYLAEKNYIINCRSGCRQLCYNFKVSDFDVENATFRFQYGHRVENDTENWIILRNFINLSFSYMTFIIKENFEKNGHQLNDFVFDIEGNDFLFNKNTIFTEGNLVKAQYDKCQFIFKNYLAEDPNLLDLL